MNNDIMLCFACAAIVGEDHPIASKSTRLLCGTCSICGRDTLCDLYSSDDEHLIRIVFNLRTKRIAIHCYNKALDMQELQAINKKCQELGWLD